MHVENQPEVCDLHLGESLVAQDAGVVDEDVDAAPLFHGAAHHVGDALFVGDAAGRGHGFAAGRLDLGDDLVGGFRRAARTVARAAEIVDDDLGAARGERQRMRATEAIAGAGDDGDAVLEGDCHF